MPKKAADLITAAEGPVGPGLEVVVRPGETNAKTRSRQKVQSFIEAVKNGLSPEDAAQKIGLDLGEVAKISSAADMKNLVSEVIGSGHIRSDLRKEALRAMLNINIANAHLEGDRKDFGALYKLAAGDPDIGLTGPSTVNAVQVNISAISDLLSEFMEPENKTCEPLDSFTVSDVSSLTDPATDQTSK